MKKKMPNVFEGIGADIGRLTDMKNAAYGDSFSLSGEVLNLLYPNGVSPAQYQNMLAIVRIIDKLFRIAIDDDAFGEELWIDITGYGILAVENTKGKSKRGKKGAEKEDGAI